MKPRIFISSTYYDLKYIRGNLERLINQYGFEPVLFESGSVYFEHNKQLDISCYNEVKLCHMMILIIGGRYGAPTNEDKQNNFVQNYEKNYISITRREFKEASSRNIPIYIFIDKNVYSEYYTFNKNKQLITKSFEDNESNFNFAFVDNINIFEFIDEVRVKAVITFEKFDDIENYLKSQWAGMFYTYLNHLISQNESNKVFQEVEELHNISERMNEMVNQIGKSILNKPGEYEEVVRRQNEKSLKYYTEKIMSNIELRIDEYLFIENPSISFALTAIFIEQLFDNPSCYDEDGNIRVVDFLLDDLEDKLIYKLNSKVHEVYPEMEIIKINYLECLEIYESKIKPLFATDGLTSLFKEYFEKLIGSEISI